LIRKFTRIGITLFCLFISVKTMAQMELVENKGQWDKVVLYRGDFSTGSFFVENAGFTMLLHDTFGLRKLGDFMHNEAGKSAGAFEFLSVAYKVKFLGAANHVKSIPEKPFNSYNNYFLGNNPSAWATHCNLYQSVLLKDVYPNIDVRYYSTAGSLKYDFIIRPGGNPNMIAMQYDGPVKLAINDKELHIGTAAGNLRELSPYSYMITENGRKEADTRFVLKDNVVTFSVKNYDFSKTLVIDPTVIFSTFTGSSADNWGYTATPGPDGSMYGGGIVFGAGYPTSAGAIRQTFAGGDNSYPTDGFDIGIIKLNAAGNQRMYATYLGGSGDEQPHSMITDAQGNLYVTGRTTSSNFPLTSARIGPGGNEDIIVCKLNATGTLLLGSVKIGGSGKDGVNIRPKYRPPEGADAIRRNYGDDARGEIMLDKQGNVIVATCTQSSSDFPVSAGNGVQTVFGGGRQDGAVLKFTSGLNLLWSVLFGGPGDDACFVADINPITSKIYIGGSTTSSTLPGPSAGTIGPSFQGGTTDGFVTIINPDASAIVRTSFMGTSGNDMLYGLKFDKHGFPYVMGTTTGNWPVLNAAYSNSGAKQFIAKLKPDFSAFVYSTVFGTNAATPNLSPVAFMVDRCENVYVSGWGGGINSSAQFPNSGTANLPERNALAGIPAPDGSDFYFFVLERNAASQLFGSHFGQNGGLGDHVDGGTSRYDENGIIYQAVCANCGGQARFPTTAGSWSPQNGSSNCNEALLKIEMNFTGVGSELQSYIDGVSGDTLGCVPLTVEFKDTLHKGVNYYWAFNDGTPVQITTTPNITHTFENVGTYQVMLISEDSSTCNIRDTSYKTISVGNNDVNLDFSQIKLPPCESLAIQFNNLSTVNAGSFGPQTFVWDFGDGSPRDTSNKLPPVNHTYAQPGNYEVTLYLIDPLFCNAPASITKTVRVNPIVTASFTTQPYGCVPYEAAFNNTSLAGTDFIWHFGDGATSTNENPTHLYPLAGDYPVTLIAIDSGTCNKIDTSDVFIIHVVNIPHAEFTWNPNPPERNVPVSFTNLSSADAVTFFWDFGDGETGTVKNPVHEYLASGEYMVTLVAYNAQGCPDTFKLPVQVLVDPLLDVPNAFTPERFGVNAQIHVIGYGITKMDWKIYNRWGQLMFHSTNKDFGWDGKYKGKLQPMDVYAYVLVAEFADGKKVTKKGDITLIR